MKLFESRCKQKSGQNRKKDVLTHIVVVFLLSVLLQRLQVILAQWFLLHQEVQHIGGVERLLTDRLSGGQVQGENVVQIVVIGLRSKGGEKETKEAEGLVV